MDAEKALDAIGDKACCEIRCAVKRVLDMRKNEQKPEKQSKEAAADKHLKEFVVRTVKCSSVHGNDFLAVNRI